jgi:hypothetical protein
MKTILITLLTLILLIPCTWAQKATHDSLVVTIFLKNTKVSVDSVFIIFDRYDRTGAGVVKRVFYPSSNKIVIEKVPKGKYYVDVFCIGVGHENISHVTTFNNRRSNKLSIPLKTFETYIPGTAVIPPSSIDPTNLIVTRSKNFR